MSTRLRPGEPSAQKRQRRPIGRCWSACDFWIALEFGFDSQRLLADVWVCRGSIVCQGGALCIREVQDKRNTPFVLQDLVNALVLVDLPLCVQMGGVCMLECEALVRLHLVCGLVPGFIFAGKPAWTVQARLGTTRRRTLWMSASTSGLLALGESEPTVVLAPLPHSAAGWSRGLCLLGTGTFGRMRSESLWGPSREKLCGAARVGTLDALYSVPCGSQTCSNLRVLVVSTHI